LLKEILDKHIILRISWVFGRYGNNFVKTILKLAKEKETLQIVRDQVGGPTPAADIARVILEIIEHDVKHWGTYHYCGSPKVSWFEFAEKIIEISKKQQLPILVKQTNKIDCADYPTKAKRPKYSELCVDKIIHDFDIKQHKWEEYLPQVIQEIFNA
jgi:dTDP-4-dehydrorhamnose reductase